MSIPLEAGDFTGEVETAWIMATLKTHCDGRAWETQVPDDVDLPRLTDGGVRPYIIARFAEPYASTRGRNIASDEQGQPHIFSFTILVIGADAGSVRNAMTDVRRDLVGKHPSLTSTQLKATGGFAYPQADTGSRPTRFERAAFFRTTINP